MATEDIVIRYKADVSELEKDLNKVIQSQNQIATTTKQTSQEVQKSVNVQAQAQQKRLQGLKLDVDRLRQIREENKKAFDTTAVNNFFDFWKTRWRVCPNARFGKFETNREQISIWSRSR